EGHREAAGVGGAEELLGVGPLALLEAGREGVGPFERPAAEAHGPVPVRQRSLPFGFGGAGGHGGLLGPRRLADARTLAVPWPRSSVATRARVPPAPGEAVEMTGCRPHHRTGGGPAGRWPPRCRPRSPPPSPPSWWAGWP